MSQHEPDLMNSNWNFTLTVYVIESKTISIYHRTLAQSIHLISFIETVRNLLAQASIKTAKTILVPEAVPLLVSTKNRDPWEKSNIGSPRFTNFPPICAFSELGLTIWFAEKTKRLLHANSETCTRSHDSWCWSKEAQPLGTRMPQDYTTQQEC